MGKLLAMASDLFCGQQKINEIHLMQIPIAS
jgi:hypothetical protein